MQAAELYRVMEETLDEGAALFKLQEENDFNEGLSDAVSDAVCASRGTECDSSIVKLHSHNISCKLF